MGNLVAVATESLTDENLRNFCHCLLLRVQFSVRYAQLADQTLGLFRRSGGQHIARPRSKQGGDREIDRSAATAPDRQGASAWRAIASAIPTPATLCTPF